MSSQQDLCSQNYEVAAIKCSCGASFLSLHPIHTSEPVECGKCGDKQAYFSDRFPVILHKIGETYHLRISTGSQENDDISTATIGSGFSLTQAFTDLMHKLKTKT
jgi:hypothetical protein